MLKLSESCKPACNDAGKWIVALLLMAFMAIGQAQSQSLSQQQPPLPNRPRPTPSPTPRNVPVRVTAARLIVAAAGKGCPQQEDFTGTITVSGATDVTYTWVSFDGGTWPEGKLHFNGPGTQTVREQVKQGAQGQVIHGWLQLKVLTPNTVLSPRANYAINCSAGNSTGRVTSASLTAVIPGLVSQCPARVTFNGTITTNGPAHVTYTWTSSDNSTWPQSTITFNVAGTASARQSWTLGAPGQSAQGWVRLKVLSPNSYISGPATFAFSCPK